MFNYVGSSEEENLFNPYNDYDQPSYNQQNSGKTQGGRGHWAFITLVPKFYNNVFLFVA